MKAIVKENTKQGAVIKDIDMPHINDDELLINVKNASICGTDVHIYNWTNYASSRITLPFIFGHECAGNVVEVGKNVKYFKKNDKVAVETHVPCGNCFQCKTGLQHICGDMKIIGVHLDGTFSEFAVVPAVCAWKLDESISCEIAATMEPFGIAVHALSKTKPAGKKIVVFGCGPIGIYAQMVAKYSGAECVIGVDIKNERLELSQKLASDIIINSSETNVANKIAEITKGSGADIVIELTGNPIGVNDAFKVLRRGGEIVLVGLFNNPVELDLVNNIIYKEANVYGVTGRIMWDTWYTAQNMILSNKVDIASVITHRYTLQDYEKAFKLAESASVGKIIFNL